MKLSKRSLSMIVAIVLCAAAAIGGTFAYLQDETAEVANVMTVGNVKISQNETFTQNSPLYPTDSEDKKVTKEITVTNDGKSPAYVRTLVKFEMGTMSEADFVKYVKWSYNTTDWTQGTAYIDGGRYVVPFTYKSALAVGATTSASLQKVWLDPSAGNDEVAKLAGEGNGSYTIYALSQAVQTDGFDTAETALNAAFGSGDSGSGDSSDSQDVGTAAEFADVMQTFTPDANGNYVIEITKDFDLSDNPSVSISAYSGVQELVINGNGHTLSGLTSPLVESAWFGNVKVTINDLTIKDSTISSGNENGLGHGAFIGYVDASGTATLNNCKLVNSTVTSSAVGAGGLVGYSSGASISINGCSVVGCTITGSSSAGAIIGHSMAGGTISNNTVTNCTINGENANKSGVVFGTYNGSGTLTVSGTTQSGNTGNVNTDHPLYGRHVGSGTLNVQ